MKTVRPQQEVTCLYETKAYYRTTIFKPGMVGTVANIVPKVILPKKGIELPSWLDRKHNFVVVDFEENGEKHRVGLNYCNITPANKL